MKVYRWVPVSIEGTICSAFKSLVIAQDTADLECDYSLENKNDNDACHPWKSC